MVANRAHSMDPYTFAESDSPGVRSAVGVPNSVPPHALVEIDDDFATPQRRPRARAATSWSMPEYIAGFNLFSPLSYHLGLPAYLVSHSTM